MIVSATELRVRSGPGTTFREMGRLIRGTRVVVREEVGDWSWVDPGEGWVSNKYLTPMRLAAPKGGLESILDMFGPPGSPQCSSGRVQLPSPIKVGFMKNTSVSRVSCHVLMAPIFSDVFQDIYRSGHWSLLKTYDGIYNDRQTKKGGKKSTHAWGIAIDLNASENQMGRMGKMDSRIVSIFQNHGFHWLGPSYDPMHFQYAFNY